MYMKVKKVNPEFSSQGEKKIIYIYKIYMR